MQVECKMIAGEVFLNSSDLKELLGAADEQISEAALLPIGNRRSELILKTKTYREIQDTISRYEIQVKKAGGGSYGS